MTTAKRQFILTASAILAAVFPLAFAMAQSTDQTASASRINSANALLRNGQLDEAIAEYQQITPSDAQRDELNYNMAVAKYRAGDVDAAASLFADAAGSGDSAVAAKARYNLGNAFYAKALQTAEHDKPTAIRQLRTAIGHYRSSLRLEPNNADARANIELAVQLIRSLEEQQQQEEQQQNQQQQQEQNDQQQDPSQEQQSDSQEPQDADQSQPQDGESHKNQSSQNEESDNSEQQQQSGEPQSDTEDSDAEQSEAPESQQQSEQQSQDSGQQSRDSQQRDDMPEDAAGQQSDEQNETEPQDVPTGELTAADENSDDQQPNGTAAIADPNANDGLMTREEALKMLQAVRDRDMLRRLRQQQVERSRHIPVDRDW